MIKKKIGIIAFGSTTIGGVHQYTQSLIDSLHSDDNFEYIVFCLSDNLCYDCKSLELRIIPKHRSNLFIKFIRFVQCLLDFKKPLFYSIDELNLYCDIDLFLSPSISLYPHYFLGKKFVFTLHDLQEKYYPQFFTFYERLMRNLMNRLLSSNSSAILCESEYVKFDIIKFCHVSENKIFKLESPPPSKLLNFEFENSKFKFIIEKYNLPSRFLIYPAYSWPHKNHIRLIHAFKKVTDQLSNVTLILLGGKNEHYTEISKVIDCLGLNERVLHLGYIPYDDLPYLYRLAEFLVMPTLFESVSIPIYEAFSIGLPVCSSNVVALPEQVRDAGLVFDPFDVDDISEKLLSLLTDVDLRLKMSLNAKNRVSNFNHVQYSKSLISVFCGILKKGS
jgi:glycosyltransferase involved in cell wall biosynthesis